MFAFERYATPEVPPASSSGKDLRAITSFRFKTYFDNVTFLLANRVPSTSLTPCPPLRGGAR